MKYADDLEEVAVPSGASIFVQAVSNWIMNDAYKITADDKIKIELLENKIALDVIKYQIATPATPVDTWPTYVDTTYSYTQNVLELLTES